MKPMLAATLETLDNVQFPVYLSPKLDGIRCLIHQGKAVSRSLKSIPNKYIQECLKGVPDGLDGELMTEGNFNTIQSNVMSEDGEPDFYLVLFDYIMDGNYAERYAKLCEIVENLKNPKLKVVSTRFVEDMDELIRLEGAYVGKKFEGVMLRNLESIYKQGRSTINEGHLLKYKRFKDAEAVIIGFEELMNNTNEQEEDNLGHSKRSSKKAGLVKSGMLGSLIMYDDINDVEFNIGTGFTQEQRKEIWKNNNKYLGREVTYTYQELTPKGIPRFPAFKAMRKE